MYVTIYKHCVTILPSSCLYSGVIMPLFAIIVQLLPLLVHDDAIIRPLLCHHCVMTVTPLPSLCNYSAIIVPLLCYHCVTVSAIIVAPFFHHLGIFANIYFIHAVICTMKIVGPSHLVIMQIGSFSRMRITAAVQFFILLLVFVGQANIYSYSDHAISVLEVYFYIFIFVYVYIYLCTCL